MEATRFTATCAGDFSFLEALYFSCITFTTIGYGDLAPIGIARFFAATEGLVGIVIASSFFVSLVKRYIEK
jgi:hypothetical protein